MHWLSETLRKAPGNGANEPNLGAGTGLIAEQERGPSRSIGHFQQVRAVAPLTRRAESSLSDNLAPQVGFEPTTLRLTAEPVVVGLGPFISEISVRPLFRIIGHYPPATTTPIYRDTLQPGQG